MRTTASALAVFLAVFCAAGAVPKASFDCTKAVTPVEKLVCSEDGLATLDVQMAAVFGKLVAAHPGDAAAIRDSQKLWLNERSSCTNDKRAENITCLAGLYRDRMVRLQGPTFLACGKPQISGKGFSLTCKAVSNPLQIAVVIAGQKSDAGEAQLSKLSLTTAGKTQSFTLDGQIFFDALASTVELMDVNFDGYADLKLATSTSAGPNMGYDYWLYVPKAGGFVATRLGEQLSGFDVMPDAKTRTIAVNGRSSCCAWNTSVYGWSGGVLRLRQSTDSGQFSPTDLPQTEALSTQLCGRETKHFNDAGLITRIDVELGATEDYACEKDDLATQAGLLKGLKAKAKGYRIEAKDNNHFTVIFDQPRKSAY